MTKAKRGEIQFRYQAENLHYEDGEALEWAAHKVVDRHSWKL